MRSVGIVLVVLSDPDQESGDRKRENNDQCLLEFHGALLWRRLGTRSSAHDVIGITEPGACQRRRKTARAGATPALVYRSQLAQSESVLCLDVRRFPHFGRRGILPAISFLTADCTFSKARTSIWRTRSRETPNSA